MLSQNREYNGEKKHSLLYTLHFLHHTNDKIQSHFLALFFFFQHKMEIERALDDVTLVN